MIGTWFDEIVHNGTGTLIWVLWIGALALIAVVLGHRREDGPRHGAQDPTRMYSSALWHTGSERAGGRCEYDGALLWTRCTSPAKHADHFYPWSRGGATSLDNLVVSCAHHNLSKSSRMPSRAQTRRIARRRLKYFPVETETTPGQWFGVKAGIR